MISKDKTYRTRDGREVRIYATDGGGLHPIHGSILMNDGWRSVSWEADGRIMFQDQSCDLIEVKPRHKRTVWLNVHDFHCFAWSSKEHADAQGGRIACIKVDLDFEEGEGITHGTYISVSSGGGSPNWESGGGFTPSVNKVIKEGLL